MATKRAKIVGTNYRCVLFAEFRLHSVSGAMWNKKINRLCNVELYVFDLVRREDGWSCALLHWHLLRNTSLFVCYIEFVAPGRDTSVRNLDWGHMFIFLSRLRRMLPSFFIMSPSSHGSGFIGHKHTFCPMKSLIGAINAIVESNQNALQAVQRCAYGRIVKRWRKYSQDKSPRLNCKYVGLLSGKLIFQCSRRSAGFANTHIPRCVSISLVLYFSSF